MVYWCILTGLAMFIMGLSIGLVVAYRLEHKIVEELLKRCKDTNERLENMLKQEEDFMQSMWPKQRHNITMETNIADYLKAKYLSEESNDWSDCDDESDNLYV